MKANNLLGVIFSNMHDELLRELTESRTMGSVPFGGRYRLIDFPLSNMVNGGVNKVGVITKSNYQSLMDHLGSGKSWDLARKKGGLFILPPFGDIGTGFYKSRIEALNGIQQFLHFSQEEYVVFSDCDVVANIDLADMFRRHLELDADITFACKRGTLPSRRDGVMVFDLGENSRIAGMRISPDTKEQRLFGLNIYIAKKSLIMEAVKDALSRSYGSLERDVFQTRVGSLKMFAYEVGGFLSVIDGMQSFVQANMALLERQNREDLFNPARPVYTKIRDEMPVRYGLDSRVVNSLIADGCKIDGTVENSIVFRGAKIAKGAVVKNSIIMQSSRVGENVSLGYVTADKNVEISPGRTLMGFESYPVFISKGTTV